MFLQIPGIPSQYIPFIIAAALLGGGVLILKIGLAMTNAESKTNMKWVAGSFFIQFGVTVFISVPMILDMILDPDFGTPEFDYLPPPFLLTIIVIFSLFVVANMINTIHQPGIIRSIVITLLILGPIIIGNYLIFSNLGKIL
ncbi:hypothetical protein LCGC14_2224420 [marine sediment metagenome]|uniref:Yip1 domain-containing protein n=1 Tax=marine sediment metagenome TaxID=412755 RepID=A0A0F9FML6_9ZZZZ